MMKARKIMSLIAGLAVVFQAAVSAQPAVTLTTLVNFNGTNGSEPFSELTFGADGNFYGTTFYAGINATQNNSGYGTVFRMSLDGTLTSLVSFDGTSGWLPLAGLTQDSQGNLYGSTAAGGTNASPYSGGNAGNIFRITTDRTFTSMFSFNNADGAFPQAPLQPGRDGNFYGITQTGGTNLNEYGTGDGTVFQISPDGRLTTLFEFNWTNGAFPMGPVLLGADGNIYGTTDNGGPNDGYGTVFKLTTNGALTTLVSFSGTNGAGPAGGLLIEKDGNLFGTTRTGGANVSQGVLGVRNDTNSVLGYGTLFRLQPDGNLKTLVYFNGTNGAYPYGSLLSGPDGKIYGTTAGYPGYAGNGTIFQLSPDGTFNTLMTFNGTNGAQPYAGLALGPDGNFYGTTSGGGAYGMGTVYRLTVPTTPVLKPIFSAGGQFVFSWNSVTGLNYQVQYNGDAGSTNWVNAAPVITAASGTTFQTNTVTGTQGFYRVLLVP